GRPETNETRRTPASPRYFRREGRRTRVPRRGGDRAGWRSRPLGGNDRFAPRIRFPRGTWQGLRANRGGGRCVPPRGDGGRSRPRRPRGGSASRVPRPRRRPIPFSRPIRLRAFGDDDVAHPAILVLPVRGRPRGKRVASEGRARPLAVHARSRGFARFLRNLGLV